MLKILTPTNDISSITTSFNYSYWHMILIFNESNDKFGKLDKNCWISMFVVEYVVKPSILKVILLFHSSIIKEIQLVIGSFHVHKKFIIIAFGHYAYMEFLQSMGINSSIKIDFIHRHQMLGVMFFPYKIISFGQSTWALHHYILMTINFSFSYVLI
jgi:hypothetical protein